MVINIATLSLNQLKQAVQLKEQIEKLQSELSATLGSIPSSQKAPTGSGMSEATKAKLRAAAKARWAKVKAGNNTSAKKAATPKKPTMSPAAKAKLSALAKARWAKAKASGKKSL